MQGCLRRHCYILSFFTIDMISCTFGVQHFQENFAEFGRGGSFRQVSSLFVFKHLTRHRGYIFSHSFAFITVQMIEIFSVCLSLLSLRIYFFFLFLFPFCFSFPQSHSLLLSIPYNLSPYPYSFPLPSFVSSISPYFPFPPLFLLFSPLASSLHDRRVYCLPIPTGLSSATCGPKGERFFFFFFLFQVNMYMRPFLHALKRKQLYACKDSVHKCECLNLQVHIQIHIHIYEHVSTSHSKYQQMNKWIQTYIDIGKSQQLN